MDSVTLVESDRLLLAVITMHLPRFHPMLNSLAPS
jgi:hypothetical protein